MRLLICAGGTGGGVYPALAVLQALGNDTNSVLWVGSVGGMETELVQRAGVPFTTIPAAGVHGVGMRALPGNVFQLARGVRASQRLLHQFRPDVLLFTGGYVAVPMAIAGIPRPSLLYVPDIEPGLALKALARFSDHIALTAKASRPFFRSTKKTSITGYPTRPDLTQWTREVARQSLGLSEDKPVILAMGGSKGARSINNAIFQTLPDLLKLTQVLHITGSLDWPEVEKVRSTLPTEMNELYHPIAYVHESMGAYLAAADVAVSRAGASTLGEYPLFGLPAILVPYPYAWRYQKVNADYLAEQGAAFMVRDEVLLVQLIPVLRSLLQRPDRLEKMGTAMRSLSCPSAAKDIAEILHRLATHQPARSD